MRHIPVIFLMLAVGLLEYQNYQQAGMNQDMINFFHAQLSINQTQCKLNNKLLSINVDCPGEK